MKTLKRILILLIILLIAFISFYLWSSGSSSTQKISFIHFPHSIEINTDSTVSLLTYNVGYLSGMTNNSASWKDGAKTLENYEKLVTIIEKEKPNLICFQEIDYHSRRSLFLDLHDSLAVYFYPWSIKAINWDNNYVPFPYWPPSAQFGKILSGQSIMSDWELADPRREELKVVSDYPFYYNAFYLDRLLVTTKVVHPIKEFILMNIHTEAFDTITRNEQLENIYHQFKAHSKEQAVVLAGDFNATPESEEAGLQLFFNDSTIACAGLNPEDDYFTYSSGDPAERIDFIFYTKKDFEEISGRVATEYGEISDHLPVYAKLKFR